LLLVALLLVAAAPDVVAQDPSVAPQSRYEKARELYKEGPSRAAEVIALLKEEIESHPKHAQAHYLLGVTFFGTDKLEDALLHIRKAIEVNETGSIVPMFHFYEAKILFHMGRCEEPKRILDAYWAFWQDRGSLQKRYAELYPQLLRQCCRSADSDSDSACERVPN